MSRKKTVILWIVLLFVLLVSGYLFPHIRRFLAVDTCLDRGGRWDYEKNVCEYTAPLKGGIRDRK